MRKKSLNAFKKRKTVNVLSNKHKKQIQGGVIGSSDISEIEFVVSPDRKN